MAVSFRDPDGRLLVTERRVLRVVNETGTATLKAFLASALAHKVVAAGQLVRTRLADAESIEQLPESLHPGNVRAEGPETIFEHERVAFPSFPYEWAPEMLHRAASLTLDLAEGALAEGFGLKDATPYNVLFRGPEPVFVDLLSFERRDPCDPVWRPYAQFARTFLLPLLANRHFGLQLSQLLLTRRDGLEPEELYALCSPIRRLSPLFLALVTIPTWLTTKPGRAAADQAQIYRERRLGDPARARFVLNRFFRRMRRHLEQVRPQTAPRSEWIDYFSATQRSDPNYLQEKHNFVLAALAKFRPRNVLDVGCNTGYFSRLAARCGASVVAIDQDPATVGALWLRAGAESLDILPLVIDVTRPSPGVGWRNLEAPSFLARAQGRFDAVLMLAVVHHLLVGERIPLAEILRLAAELTTDLLIVEFVAPDDPLFRLIARGRDHLFQDLTHEAFAGACLERFEILRWQQLSGTSRRIFLLKKR
ncbi:MAG TPA: class I SAM-dependent methyltransferase [Blastocatellia bacterium]|nr:class I SAM-dependent methyltransferase [Blastocatellia bacterium]